MPIQDVVDVEEIENKNLELREITQGKVLELSTASLDGSVLKKHAGLFSVSNLFGYFVASTHNGFVLDTTRRLRAEYTKDEKKGTQKFVSLVSVTTPSIILAIRLSSDEQQVIVLLDQGVVLFYRVTDLFAKNSAPRKIQLKSAVVDLKVNPDDKKKEHIAVLYANGKVEAVNLEGGSVFSVSGEGYSAISWSPKGKGLLIGKNTGTVVHATLKGEIKDTFLPCEENKGLRVVGLNWIETKTFMAAFYHEEEERYDFSIISGDSSAYKVTRLESILFALCQDSGPVYFFPPHIKNWSPKVHQLAFVQSGASPDVEALGVVTGEDGQKKWIWWTLSETSRASVSGAAHSDDIPPTPIGMALDFTSDEVIPSYDDDDGATPPPLQPMPTLFVYSSEGFVSGYRVFNREAGKKKLPCPAMVTPTQLALPSSTTVPLAMPFVAPTVASGSTSISTQPSVSTQRISSMPDIPYVLPSPQPLPPVVLTPLRDDGGSDLVQIRNARELMSQAQSPAAQAEAQVGPAMQAIANELEHTYLSMKNEIFTLQLHTQMTEAVIESRAAALNEIGSHKIRVASRIQSAVEHQKLAKDVKVKSETLQSREFKTRAKETEIKRLIDDLQDPEYAQKVKNRPLSAAQKGLDDRIRATIEVLGERLKEFEDHIASMKSPSRSLSQSTSRQYSSADLDSIHRAIRNITLSAVKKQNQFDEMLAQMDHLDLEKSIHSLTYNLETAPASPPPPVPRSITFDGLAGPTVAKTKAKLERQAAAANRFKAALASRGGPASQPLLNSLSRSASGSGRQSLAAMAEISASDFVKVLPQVRLPRKPKYLEREATPVYTWVPPPTASDSGAQTENIYTLQTKEEAKVAEIEASRTKTVLRDTEAQAMAAKKEVESVKAEVEAARAEASAAKAEADAARVLAKEKVDALAKAEAKAAALERLQAEEAKAHAEERAALIAEAVAAASAAKSSAPALDGSDEGITTQTETSVDHGKKTSTADISGQSQTDVQEEQDKPAEEHEDNNDQDAEGEKNDRANENYAKPQQRYGRKILEVDGVQYEVESDGEEPDDWTGTDEDADAEDQEETNDVPPKIEELFPRGPSGNVVSAFGNVKSKESLSTESGATWKAPGFSFPTTSGFNAATSSDPTASNGSTFKGFATGAQGDNAFASSKAKFSFFDLKSQPQQSTRQSISNSVSKDQQSTSSDAVVPTAPSSTPMTFASVAASGLPVSARMDAAVVPRSSQAGEDSSEEDEEEEDDEEAEEEEEDEEEEEGDDEEEYQEGSESEERDDEDEDGAYSERGLSQAPTPSFTPNPEDIARHQQALDSRPFVKPPRRRAESRDTLDSDTTDSGSEEKVPRGRGGAPSPPPSSGPSGSGVDNLLSGFGSASLQLSSEKPAGAATSTSATSPWGASSTGSWGSTGQQSSTSASWVITGDSGSNNNHTPAMSSGGFGAAPATSVSGFGSSATTMSSGFGSTPATSSGFGSSSATTTTSSFIKPSVSGFGQNPTLGFGQQPPSTSPGFGQNSSTTTFGQTSSATTSPASHGGFGQGTGFGQTSPATTGGFGSFAPAQTSTPAFGQPAFGQPSQLGSGGAPGFGQTSQLGGVAFGQPSQLGSSNNSVFGQTSAMGTGGAAFGQPSQLGSGGSAFGQPSQLGAGTGFGQVSRMGATNNAVFGAAATGAGQPSFGSGFAAASTNAFSALAKSATNVLDQQAEQGGSSVFSQQETPSVFGSGGGFGGNSGQTSVFGSGGGFGQPQQPSVFGSGGGFGQPQQQQGFGQQAGGGFGGFASQQAGGFGQPQQPNVFGSGVPNPNKPSFSGFR